MNPEWSGGHPDRSSRAEPPRRRIGGAWLLAIAAASAPLIIRTVLLLERTGPLAGADLAGFFSDLGISLLFAAFLTLAARPGVAVAVGASVFWGLLHYANYEHVRELGAGLDFTFAHYLGDPTFLLGSALSPSRPSLLAIAATLPPVLCWLATRSGNRKARGSGLSVAGCASLLVALVIPHHDELHAWRQHHFAIETVAGFLSRESLDSRTPDGSGRLPELAADLTGEPRIPLPGSARNVLLVVLEGLPATVVESLAAVGGSEESFVMPYLSDLAARNIVADNFVLHQRQTNRGLFSLLCGDYPKLDRSLAKMTAYLNDSSRNCLPRVLRRAGYATAYLQGAPLAFMYKDAFGRLAGFDRVYGNKDFESPRRRTYWGVDDRSLLLRTVDLMRELRHGGTPWFLTLLSVGTHHPTVVPRSLQRSDPKSAFEAAAIYLDRALAEFFATLDSEGMLEDTLVLVTSDESRGDRTLPDLRHALSANWGPLVIAVPEGKRERIAEPYGHSDVALSILDYLGIESARSEFIGRSLFRAYATPRRVYFSNVFLHKAGAVDGAGSLLYCDERLESCAKYASAPETLFLPGTRADRIEPGEVADLEDAIRYSGRDGTSSQREFRYDLVGTETVPLVRATAQVLMGGQNFNIPASSRIEVEIELRITGARGSVALDHALHVREGGDRMRERVGELGPGDRAEIRYAYDTNEPLENVKVNLVAMGAKGSELSIRFERAQIRVRSLDEPSAAPGFVSEPEIAVHRNASLGSGS